MFLLDEEGSTEVKVSNAFKMTSLAIVPGESVQITYNAISRDADGIETILERKVVNKFDGAYEEVVASNPELYATLQAACYQIISDAEDKTGTIE